MSSNDSNKTQNPKITQYVTHCGTSVLFGLSIILKEANAGYAKEIKNKRISSSRITKTDQVDDETSSNVEDDATKQHKK